MGILIICLLRRHKLSTCLSKESHLPTVWFEGFREAKFVPQWTDIMLKISLLSIFLWANALSIDGHSFWYLNKNHFYLDHRSDTVKSFLSNVIRIQRCSLNQKGPLKQESLKNKQKDADIYLKYLFICLPVFW